MDVQMVLTMGETTYSPDHVGENPVPNWPMQIKGMKMDFGADQIVENIEDCAGCSKENGLCDHHRGQIEGYDQAKKDYVREFRARMDEDGLTEPEYENDSDQLQT